MAVVDIVWTVIEKCDWVTVTPLSGTGNTFVEIRTEEAPIKPEYSKEDLECNVVFEATINGVKTTTSTCVKRCPRECDCPGDFHVEPVKVLPKEDAEHIIIGTYFGSDDFMESCLVGPSIKKPSCGCNILRIFEDGDNANEDDEQDDDLAIDDWINNISFENGSIYADVDKNRSEDTRETNIDIYYSSGKKECDSLTLTVTQAGSRCICENFSISDVGIITTNDPSLVVTIGTYNFDIKSDDKPDACYEVLNVSTDVSWVTNIVFDSVNNIVTANLGETTEYGVERYCNVSVSYLADGESCETEFTVTQKVESPIIECSCDKLVTTPQKIGTKTIISDKDSLPCIGGDIQFDLVSYGNFKMISYQDNSEATQFTAKDKMLIGTYDFLNELCNQDLLSFEAAPDNGNTKVCLEWGDGNIYAYIDGIVTPREYGSGVKINAIYNENICENASFYIDVESVKYTINMIDGPASNCGGGNYTFKAIIQG